MVKSTLKGVRKSDNRGMNCQKSQLMLNWARKREIIMWDRLLEVLLMSNELEMTIFNRK